MDRFLSKCPQLISVSQPPSKKPSPASVRVAEFGRNKFYADGGKLFCRACNVVIEHRTHTEKHCAASSYQEGRISLQFLVDKNVEQ